ncbi:MAG: peptide deformylase, partial [Desulfobacteraceae bacterium]|nr:peptide deformylase [Desulfobacteraceae bacterium]
MSVKNVLFLGDEQLYEFCRPIEQGEMDIAKKILNDLGDTMDNFKKKYGFGRAIAAPQIGQSRRVVYLNTGDQKIHFINPELEFLSQEKFKIWDDCMSFPGLEVLVWRYKKVKVFYKDLDFKD